MQAFLNDTVCAIPIKIGYKMGSENQIYDYKKA